MPAISTTFAAGGSGLSPTHDLTLAAAIIAGKVDLGVIRTAITTMTAKLDLDTLVNDTDYASSLDPAALTLADVGTVFGATGKGLSPTHDTPTSASALTQVKADLTAIRTAVTGLTAKLDADSGVNDTDYASSLDPAALTTSTVGTEFGACGKGLNPTHDAPTLASVLRLWVDDMTAIRNAIVGITAKLDLDTGVTDTDYASTCDPAALTLTKA